jgi:transcriptional regulator with XRE-family HTH domain
MQDFAHRVGTAVRTHREAAGLSQQALGSRANVATRTIARIEAGEDARLGTVVRLARALAVPVADLFLEPAAEVTA